MSPGWTLEGCALRCDPPNPELMARSPFGRQLSRNAARYELGPEVVDPPRLAQTRPGERVLDWGAGETLHCQVPAAAQVTRRVVTGRLEGEAQDHSVTSVSTPVSVAGIGAWCRGHSDFADWSLVEGVLMAP